MLFSAMFGTGIGLLIFEGTIARETALDTTRDYLKWFGYRPRIQSFVVPGVAMTATSIWLFVLAIALHRERRWARPLVVVSFSALTAFWVVEIFLVNSSHRSDSHLGVLFTALAALASAQVIRLVTDRDDGRSDMTAWGGTGTQNAGERGAEPASIADRVGARVLDVILYSSVGYPPVFALYYFVLLDAYSPQELLDILGPTAGVIAVLYEAVMIGIQGQTFGKARRDIFVVGADGRRKLQWWRCVIRTLALAWIMYPPAWLIALVWRLVDRRRRLLHDTLARSAVLRTREYATHALAGTFLKPGRLDAFRR